MFNVQIPDPMSAVLEISRLILRISIPDKFHKIA